MPTDNYFAVLGVRAHRGRLFVEGDAGSAQEPVLVLSDHYWRLRFGADPSIIGQTVHLGSKLFVVLGVAAPEFRGSQLFADIDLWMPATSWEALSPGELVQREQESWSVFGRLAPGAKAPTAVVADFNRPNGIVFSPDKKILYISDSGSPHHIRYFSVAGECLEEIGVFAVISPGGPDGMCVDSEGRLYSTAGDGVHVFSPDGTLIGKIITPRMPANCCFGGKEWKTLFITARPDVYAVKLKVKGLP